MENMLKALQEIILGILSIDNDYRRVCEQRLEEFKKEPDSLVLGLLKLLQTLPNPDSRKISGVLLKRYISSISDANDCLWEILTDDTQKVIKEQLLKSLALETDIRVGRIICLAVAELTETIHSRNEVWLDVDGFMHKMITEGNELQKKMGYLMMNYIFKYIRERYESHCEELSGLFLSTLTKDCLEVRMESIEA